MICQVLSAALVDLGTLESEDIMATSYEVYSGIDIPPVQRTGRQGSKYPFATMAVGEMFFLPAADVPKSFSSQRNAAQRRLSRKFVSRRAVLNDVEGVGCWRTE